MAKLFTKSYKNLTQKWTLERRSYTKQ